MIPETRIITELKSIDYTTGAISHFKKQPWVEIDFAESSPNLQKSFLFLVVPVEIYTISPSPLPL